MLRPSPPHFFPNISRPFAKNSKYLRNRLRPLPPLPLISIASTSFHRSLPSQDPPLFPNLTFSLHPHSPWAILGPSPVKCAFLDVLQGGAYLPNPPSGRQYPELTRSHKSPTSTEAIARVEFGSKTGGMVGGGADGGGYISARYESLRGAEDVTLEKWLISGAALNTDPNPVDVGVFGRVVRSLRLADLLAHPVMMLSHGQVRRAKLAAALLNRPLVLLVDEPFMGLDPPSTFTISHLLQEMSEKPKKNSLVNPMSTTPVLALRPQDPVPSWIENVAVLGGEYNVVSIGKREDVVREMAEVHNTPLNTDEPWTPKAGLFAKVWQGVDEYGNREDAQTPNNTTTSGDSQTGKEPLLTLSSITIKYGALPRYILRDFSWTIRRGDRWGVFGPNGSGKTTLLALLTSDHPQTYSQDVTVFGHRRGDPGVSVFDVQSRIGHSSPEMLAFWPRHLSLRRTVEAAWAETPLAKPALPPGADSLVDAIMSEFADALPRSTVAGVEGVDGDAPFAELSPSQQRLALFLRAVVKKPDLLILDEAFAGMEGAVRDKCLVWLDPVEKGGKGGLEDRQAMVVVSHVEEEVPRVVESWVRLGGGGSAGGERDGELEESRGGAEFGAV
ncbi:P-loop containing nucleoside triphosphate hydrolase protein [Tirmania nivea]|nr:P-loop containing nucleoside triphosphate hydrolase protein [Tirmania nivea]